MYLYDVPVDVVEKSVYAVTEVRDIAEEKGIFKKYNWDRLNSIFYGGESADINAIKSLWKTAPHVHIYNGYGPTETVVICSCHEVRKEDIECGEIPIGLPLKGLEFYLKGDRADTENECLEGELLVAGEQMLKFYCNDQKVDTFMIRNAKKYYPTGDIVVYKHGMYYLLGRKSKMIKIRGYRIFPAEIENVIKLVDFVSEVVVFKHMTEEKLVAIIETIEKEDSILLERIREVIKNYLPL